LHLFAYYIFCWNVDESERLNRLLRDWPHLGALHVRCISLNLQDSAFGSVPQLLSYFTNLTRLKLCIDSPSFVYNPWSAAVKLAVLETLARPSLCALSINCY
jgi:hypothetical protein